MMGPSARTLTLDARAISMRAKAAVSCIPYMWHRIYGGRELALKCLRRARVDWPAWALTRQACGCSKRTRPPGISTKDMVGNGMARASLWKASYGKSGTGFPCSILLVGAELVSKGGSAARQDWCRHANSG